jgi:hypothetical protein
MFIRIDSDKMDWGLLRQQKLILLHLREQVFSNEDKDTLSGMIHLLDYIQDIAVEQGLSEEEVFGEEIKQDVFV